MESCFCVYCSCYDSGIESEVDSNQEGSLGIHFNSFESVQMNIFTDGIIKGSKKISLPVLMRTSEGEQVDLLAANIMASYWRENEFSVPIVAVDLPSLDQIHTPGGWLQVDKIRQPGMYRLDVPDAAFVEGEASWIIVTVTAPDAINFHERFALISEAVYMEEGEPLSVLNSYVYPNTAESYFDTRLGTDAWDDASPEDRNKALIQATRMIDRLRFKGLKADPDQPLEFPRITDNINLGIPLDIQIATCELALVLLDGIDPEREIKDLYVSNRSFVTTRVQFERSYVPEHTRAGIPSATSWSYLKPYLLVNNTIILNRM